MTACAVNALRFSKTALSWSYGLLYTLLLFLFLFTQKSDRLFSQILAYFRAFFADAPAFDWIDAVISLSFVILPASFRKLAQAFVSSSDRPELSYLRFAACGDSSSITSRNPLSCILNSSSYNCDSAPLFCGLFAQ